MNLSKTLKECSFFKECNEDQLKTLAKIAVEESYKAGAQIYKKGDPAKNFYILLEGKVLMAMESYMGTHKPTKQVTVDILAKGDAMGWSAIVEPYAYTLGARCIDDAKMIAFDAVKLRALLNKDHTLGFKFMQATAKVIASRLTHTEIILVGERSMSELTEY